MQFVSLIPEYASIIRTSVEEGHMLDRTLAAVAFAGPVSGNERAPSFSQPQFGGSSPRTRRQRGSAWAAVKASWLRHRTRRYLAALDAQILKDIGITYAEAEAEANKPFWSA